MRVIGLDFGSRTCGIAISDPTGLIASPLETVCRDEEVALKSTVRRIRALTEEYDVHTIVLGLPRNMNNTMGERAEKTLAFKKRLERDLYQVEIILWDERLSTAGVERPLLDTRMDRRDRKQVIDKMAAAYILQGWMDAQKNMDKNEGSDTDPVNKKEKRAMDDELNLVTLYDEETDSEQEFELAIADEINGVMYYMIAELGALDADEDSESADEADEDDDDDENTAYIFRECDEENAEFTMTIEGKDVYITSEMSDEDYETAVNLFMQSEDFEIEREEEEV